RRACVRGARGRRGRRALAGGAEPRLRGRGGPGGGPRDRPARPPDRGLRPGGGRGGRARRESRDEPPPLLGRRAGDKRSRGAHGGKRDAVLLNAAGAIAAGGLAHDLAEGVGLAREAVDSGAAGERLEALIAFSQEPAVTA